MNSDITRRKLILSSIIGVFGFPLLNSVVAQQTDKNQKDKSKDKKEHPQNSNASHTKAQTAQNSTQIKGEPQNDNHKERQANSDKANELLQKGRQDFRNQGEIDDWKNLMNDLQNGLAITTNGSVSGDVKPNFLKIEHGFNYEVIKPSDDSFLSFHIEPLLDQAANLLERGMADRAEWDDKSIKMLNLALELHQYWELDKVLKNEEAAGLYQNDFFNVAQDVIAERERNVGNAQSLFWTNNILTILNSRDVDLWNASIRAAWVSGLVNSTFQGQRFDHYEQPTYGTIKDTIANHFYQTSSTLKRFELDNQRLTLLSQISAFQALGRSSNEKIIALEHQLEWERQNANFKKLRNDIPRRMMDIKTKATLNEDGILNYSKRLISIKSRFQEDFANAIARLQKVYIGAKDVYGYDQALPSDPESVTYFDDCLLWARKLINWINRFSRIEQDFVLPISIKSLISNEEWNQGLHSGSWKILIPREFFPDQYHLRLRGISVFVEKPKRKKITNGLYAATIKAPSKSTYYHLDGSEHPVDQTIVPKIRLGRVGTRDFVRAPDIAGANTLFNVSPIGEWEINLKNPLILVSSEDQKEHITNLYLDLHITSRLKNL
jgi:hypothetical protein